MYQGIPLTLGVEEEYQIIDPRTMSLHSFSKELLEQAQQEYPEANLKPEFMQSQIESNSNVCADVKDVRRELQRLRGVIIKKAQENGLGIVAASTHPFANWKDQKVSENPRYQLILDQLRGVIAPFLIFGFHVHVGFGGNNDLMIEMMNQLRYFLPHVLALSTSSPFWLGDDSGLKSYRSVIFEALPRTGIPQRFNSYSEYWDYVELLGKVGSIADPVTGKPDASKIWWDVRPSPKFGTLEIRIADLPTRIEESVCIAAVIQGFIAKLIQLRNRNMSWRRYRRHHFTENKWRAMRFGIDGDLIDYGKAVQLPFRSLALEIIAFLDDVVDELNSRQEVEYIKTILRDGTSADRQLETYRLARASGKSNEDALKAVVARLMEETKETASL